MEGTYVHELCEYKIRTQLGESLEKPYNKLWHSREAEMNSDLFSGLVIREATCLKHSKVLVEERLDFSHIVPDGFGMGDALILSPERLHIFDYKNGRGVFVEADHNTQMMLYALGAVHMYDADYHFKRVLMTIVQPNLNNIKTFEMTIEELLKWGEDIKPLAKMAYEGAGERVPGDWCMFCKAKRDCLEGEGL